MMFEMIIYYYTPLPLNLANNNNKQATTTTSKQAHLLSVLANTPSQHYGLYSTLAILDPRWCPGQIQVLGPKLNGGAAGQLRQFGGCPPKSAHFLPPKQPFFGLKGPKTIQNGQTKGNGFYTTCAP